MDLRILGFFVLFLVGIVSKNAHADIKVSDLAGGWYEDDKKILSEELDVYLDKADPVKIDNDIIALISPHAGLPFSGPISAYGYKLLKDKKIDTVIVVGFNHAYSHKGIAVSDYDAVSTPLGDIKINKEISKALIDSSENIYADKKAFEAEQSTELQMPFIKKVLPKADMVVLSIGDQSLDNSHILAESLYETLKDKDNYIMVASSDMCHFLEYDENNKVDEFSINYLKKFDPNMFFMASLKNQHRLACGYGAITAVMSAAKKLGANKVKILKHANSGDISSDKSRVVGYLSAAMYENKEEVKKSMFTDEQKKKMLKLARNSINSFLTEGKKFEVEESDPLLNEEMGAFVTLHKNGQLRGCIGNITGRGPFYLTVRDMAVNSAVNDPRFANVTADEMDDIHIEISALTPMKKVQDLDDIIIPGHGVLVSDGLRSGVYLPQVATEAGWDKEEFMNSLCGHKAGMATEAWKKGECEIFIFEAEVFEE